MLYSAINRTNSYPLSVGNPRIMFLKEKGFIQ